jgi:hypothetical protein
MHGGSQQPPAARCTLYAAAGKSSTTLQRSTAAAAAQRPASVQQQPVHHGVGAGLVCVARRGAPGASHSLAAAASPVRGSQPAARHAGASRRAPCASYVRCQMYHSSLVAVNPPHTAAGRRASAACARRFMVPRRQGLLRRRARRARRVCAGELYISIKKERGVPMMNPAH